VSPSPLQGSVMADAASRSDLPSNRMVGSTLLTVMALSDASLLAALRHQQVLRHVELSLHSSLGFIAQDLTWRSAWHALDDLKQVLTHLAHAEVSLVEPYDDLRVIQIWRNIGTHLSVLRGLMRYAALLL
jgi:hypothetical protein